MSHLFFITHPEVSVDPALPVTRWSLSPRGRARMAWFIASDVLEQVAHVFSSTEQKAIDAATPLAAARGVGLRLVDALGENDRKSTGYLESAQFELAADAFFAAPAQSYRGWETALAAQARIVGAVERSIADAAGTGDIAIVSHGAVGTLFKCFLKGVPISRAEDQPRQGHFFRVDIASGRLLSDWTPLPDA
ncbi:MAG: histidine phosphatase family protein [Polyangiales bacterium]